MSHLKDGTTQSCGCYRKTKNIIEVPIGSKYGKLTVQSVVEDDPASLNCLCDCGQTCIAKGKELRRGHKKSCGCLVAETSAINGRLGLIDLTGQRFGKLIVLKETPKELRRTKAVYWECLCDCGNLVSVASDYLRRGSTTSCGCIRQLDISGQKFGKLTAIERDNNFSKNHKYKHSFWKCKCDCGNEILVFLGHLQNGHTTSCGCDKSSKGEKEISSLLDSANLNYIHDKQYFKDLILPSGGIGRYDYIILDENNVPQRIIEFDGEQHFKDCWSSVENVKLNDEVKNQYAFEHNIPIIRIPYWERNNITLDMLMGDIYEIQIMPDMEEAQDVTE